MICYAILNLFNGSRNNFFTITSSSQTSTINCRHQKGTEDSSRPPHPERRCKSLKHTCLLCVGIAISLRMHQKLWAANDRKEIL